MAWYNFNDIRSHNAMMSFVLSARGGGKTYGAKMIGIKNWLKDKSEFAYVRRMDTELATRDKFFKDIIDNQEFPEFEFSVIGYTGYIRRKADVEAGEEVEPWETLCHFFPLSLQVNFKSTPYPRISMIFYDEVIIDTTSGKKRYLNNEPRELFELMSTIIRDRSGVKFIGMANNISLVNPHFIYWNLKVNPNKRFTKSKSGKVIVELWQNDEFEQKMEQTEFGALAMECEYGQYSIHNKSLIDNNAFIIKRPSNLIHLMGFIIEGKSIHCWKNKEDGTLYIDNTSNGINSEICSITDIDHSPSFSSIMSLKRRPLAKAIRRAKEQNNVYYKDIQVMNLFENVFKYL